MLLIHQKIQKMNIQNIIHSDFNVQRVNVGVHFKNFLKGFLIQMETKKNISERNKMIREKSNREIFKDHNQRKQTEKIYKSLSSNSSFDEMKNKRDEFQEISETLREETRVRRKKRELKKLKDEIEQFEKEGNKTKQKFQTHLKTR